MLSIDFKTKNNGLPILSKKDIEDIAEQIFYSYKSGKASKDRVIDLDHFIECHLGLEMDYQDLSHDKSILGMIAFDNCKVPVYDPEQNKAKRIIVNQGTILLDNSLLEDDQVRRGRFTLAHEVAHWFLHRQMYSQNMNQMSIFESLGCEEPTTPTIKCRSIDIERDGKKQLVTDDDWIEWQADYLASTILMPKQEFCLVVREKFKSAGITQQSYKLGTDFEMDLWADVMSYELADMFDVSVTAARIRLKNLGFIKDQHDHQQFLFEKFQL